MSSPVNDRFSALYLGGTYQMLASQLSTLSLSLATKTVSTVSPTSILAPRKTMSRQVPDAVLAWIELA